MGDISEMIMKGVLCERCGCLIEDLIQKGTDKLLPGPGYPRLCDDCQKGDADENKGKGKNKRHRHKSNNNTNRS